MFTFSVSPLFENTSGLIAILYFSLIASFPTIYIVKPSLPSKKILNNHR